MKTISHPVLKVLDRMKALQLWIAAIDVNIMIAIVVKEIYHLLNDNSIVLGSIRPLQALGIYKK